MWPTCSFVLVLQRFKFIKVCLRLCNNFALDVNYFKIMNLLFYTVALLYFFLFASTSDCSSMISSLINSKPCNTTSPYAARPKSCFAHLNFYTVCNMSADMCHVLLKVHKKVKIKKRMTP